MGFPNDFSSWQGITIDLIDRFGEEIYERRLRIRDFVRGESRYSHALFMHFGPLLRLLRLKSDRELATEKLELVEFFAFQLADRNKALSTGCDGLEAINSLIKRSKVSISTFVTAEEWQFRAKCVRWMMDELFPLFDRESLIEMFNNNNTIHLIELVLSCSTDPIKLIDLLIHLLKMPAPVLEEQNIILMIIAYTEITKNDWRFIENHFRSEQID